jgi:hypothetical protein
MMLAGDKTWLTPNVEVRPNNERILAFLARSEV